jgi:hypothetical protein
MPHKHTTTKRQTHSKDYNFMPDATQLKLKNWPTQKHKKLKTCYMLKSTKRKIVTKMHSYKPKG